MTHDLFTVAEAKAKADLGMARAVEHADAVVPDWSQQAGSALLEYAAAQSAPWMAESLREWALGRGLPRPPDGRAWGSVVQRAARAGDIVKVGYGSARSSNNSPKRLWSAR